MIFPKLLAVVSGLLCASLSLGATAFHQCPMMTLLPAKNLRNLTAEGMDWLTPEKRQASLFWKVPDNIKSGYYVIRFLGSLERQPTIIESEDLDPYRIIVYPGEGNAGERKTDSSFTFVRQSTEVLRLNGLPAPFRQPTLVGWRQTSRIFHLVPGDRIKMEMRYPYTLVSALGVEPVNPAMCIQLTAKGTAENHVFTDREPPRFEFLIQNLGEKPFFGALRLIVGDAVTGKETSHTRTLQITAGGKISPTEDFDVANGVYYLKVDLLDSKGQLLTRLWRHFSYSPYIDARDLPLTWPFGFHLKEEDPMPPPVGLKWVRIFRPGWYELQPEEDALDWSSFDYQVERCEQAGHPILFIGFGTPRWARPGSPEGFRAFAKNPPTKEGALEGFLRAFWERYAPGGEINTVRAIEIFNEPNTWPVFKGNYKAYADYAKVIYETTKDMAPEATVVGISLSGGMHEHFVNGVLDAGAGQYMDVASLHLYEIGNPLGKGVTMENKIRMFKKQLDAHGLSQLPIWNTESGGKIAIRNEGVMLNQEALNGFYRQHTAYNPLRAWVVDRHWVEVSEELMTAWIIRGSLQQLAMGIEKNFYFQWTSFPHGWVSDWGPGGNPMPRLKIPAQAVLSQLWLDYAGAGTEILDLESPDPEFWVLGFRYTGAKGKMTAVFTHPQGADRGSEDSVAAIATGENNVHSNKPTVRYDPFTRREAPPPITLRVPVQTDTVEILDWLDRKRDTVESSEGFIEVTVGETPVYILEIDRE